MRTRIRLGEEAGFSLIEMLVVIVILAILASIAIPAFLNQRERAWKAQSETALKNAATAMEAAAVSTNGTYAGVTVRDLVDEEGLKYAPRITRLDVESSNDQGFCISVDHASGGVPTYYWDSAVGRPSTVNCSGAYP